MKNVNIDYCVMPPKLTSGFITQRVTTNNTYSGWACFDSNSKGISFGLQMQNNVYNTFMSFNNGTFFFSTVDCNLYSIAYIPGVSRHTQIYTNLDINM
jgi:hypothetical protein